MARSRNKAHQSVGCKTKLAYMEGASIIAYLLAHRLNARLVYPGTERFPLDDMTDANRRRRVGEGASIGKVAPSTWEWCGEGDLFCVRVLKTSKLYTPQRPQNTKSARNTQLSHTVCHTMIPEPVGAVHDP